MRVIGCDLSAWGREEPNWMQSKKPNRFPSNASGVGLVFGEEHRRKTLRNIDLNGNLLLPFIFHFQPRVMDCLSLIFFQGLLGWLCIFYFLFLLLFNNYGHLGDYHNQQ